MNNLIFSITLIIIALYFDDKLKSAFCHFKASYINGPNSVMALDHYMFFAQNDSGEKTEDPTSKKKKDSKKKGQVAKSKELNALAGLLTIIVILITLGPSIMESLQGYLVSSVNGAGYIVLDSNSAPKLLAEGFAHVLSTVAIVLIPILVVGVSANIAQVGFILSGEPIKFDIKKINPIAGAKRIFSKKMFFEFAKNIAKLTAIGLIVYTYFDSKKDDLIISGLLNEQLALAYMGNIVIGLLFRIAFIFIIIAALDFAFEKYTFKKQQRMSKQEVKEEYKEMEGDPQIKGRRRQKQRQMSYNRMMSEIPNASVVITNPTHFAVAIRYEDGTDEVPIVVAKGVDYLAQKIKEIAKENDIEIVENKPLARQLYKDVEIDQYIPVELYQVMAEILSMVYNKR
jgi:flagellar biosynthetic protein FliR/FlhB